jgi:hypothetical protein
MTVGVVGKVSPTAKVAAGADRARLESIATQRSSQAGRCAAGTDRTAVGLGGMQRAPIEVLTWDDCTDSEICLAVIDSAALDRRISPAGFGWRRARMSGVLNRPIKTGKANGAHHV